MKEWFKNLHYRNHVCLQREKFAQAKEVNSRLAREVVSISFNIERETIAIEWARLSGTF